MLMREYNNGADEAIFLERACSTGPPSGNQVDGLPLVAHTGEDHIGHAPFGNYVGVGNL